MPKHQKDWTAQDDLDLLVAVCRSNRYFSKPQTKWHGVEEYLAKRGHKRPTIAIRSRFNRVIRPRIRKETPEADYQIPCQTLGDKPLLFSIPWHLLHDSSAVSDIECPAISPSDFGDLKIKLVNISSVVNIAAEPNFLDRNALPTQVGAVTLDGSYQAFLVNRDSLHGAKELSYTLPSINGCPSSAPKDNTKDDDNDDVFSRGFSLPFPNTRSNSPQLSSNNSNTPIFTQGYDPMPIPDQDLVPLIGPMERLMMGPPSLPYHPPESQQRTPTRRRRRRRQPQTPSRQTPFPVEWFMTPQAEPNLPLSAGPATPTAAAAADASGGGGGPWLRTPVTDPPSNPSWD
ncbi:hypothetical protein F4810DRAFT_255480 [Camillea tinctor]|nr:hypothetical protein F4810DRAFT_255480 [Camillea tinctor]